MTWWCRYGYYTIPHCCGSLVGCGSMSHVWHTWKITWGPVSPPTTSQTCPAIGLGFHAKLSLLGDGKVQGWWSKDRYLPPHCCRSLGGYMGYVRHAWQTIYVPAQPTTTPQICSASPDFQGQVRIYTLSWVIDWTKENDTGSDMKSHCSMSLRG